MIGQETSSAKGDVHVQVVGRPDFRTSIAGVAAGLRAKSLIPKAMNQMVTNECTCLFRAAHAAAMLWRNRLVS